MSEGGEGTEVAEVRGGFTDWVSVDGEPCVENGNVEQRFDLRQGVEWVSEVVNVKDERGAVELDDGD